MRTTLLLVPALALLVASAAPAGAHIESFSEATSFNVGPYSTFFDPRPVPLYENTTLSFSTIITDKRTGAIARDVDATLTVVAPSGAQKSTKLTPDDQQYYIGSLVVDERGEHNARLTITDQEGTHSNETTFEVYPDLPFRVEPADAAMDQYAGQPQTMRFEIYDPRDLGPAPVDDVTMRVEHWTDDHKTMLGATETPLEKRGGILWQADVTFPEPGMYHLRFASESGGFTYDDVPLLHMYALEAPESEDARSVPAPALAAAAFALWLAARVRGRA